MTGFEPLPNPLNVNIALLRRQKDRVPYIQDRYNKYDGGTIQ